MTTETMRNVMPGKLAEAERCARLSELLGTRYARGANGENNTFDCWGLAVHWLHLEYGLQLPALAEWVGGAQAHTAGYDAMLAESIALPKPVPGAVGCVLVGGLLEHVGVVVRVSGEMRVLHTSERRGARLDTIRNFGRLHNSVEYRLHLGLRGGAGDR